jgi:hypothetical protein
MTLSRNAEAIMSTELASVTNRKPRAEDALNQAERRAGMTVWDVVLRVPQVLPVSKFEIYTRENCRHAITRNRALLDSLPDDASITDLAAAAKKGLAISTPSIVAREVATFLGAFPNAGLPSPQIFISSLIFDLLDLKTPDAIIVQAFRDLRRSSKFVPAISEVIGVTEQLRTQWQKVADLPGKLQDVRRQLSENIATAEASIAAMDRKASEPAEAKPTPCNQPPRARRYNCCFPSLQVEWEADPAMLELLGRASFEHQANASSLLARKGEPAARQYLEGKIGAAP